MRPHDTRESAGPTHRARRETPVSPPAAARDAPRVFAFDRWLTRLVLRSLGNPNVGVVLWNGEGVRTADGPASAWVELPDRRTLFKLLTNPTLAFGDGYADGRIAVRGDLRELAECGFRAAERLREERPLLFRLRSLKYRYWRNPLRRARNNIHHHYDIGNDFYRLWLDERMVYTCAYYAEPNLTLEQAQLAKMDHVARKLRLRPGESVVEAGCGWGALALHMARHYGVTVRAFNISREQIAYARERARREGLGDRVEFVEDDFRNISGQYDAFVSVGMLEHVGTRNYRRLGEVIHRSLKPSGRGLVHSIGRNRPGPIDPWLSRRIFPGADIPALSQIMNVFEPRNFSVLDVENLRFHYARTLGHWLERFEGVTTEVEKLFDARFVRMWRLYLVGSMASFTAGSMQLFQVVFAPNGNADVPRTRDHIYRDWE